MIRCCGNLKPGVDERRPNPLARLAHRRVGEADERERRQARCARRPRPGPPAPRPRAARMCGRWRARGEARSATARVWLAQNVTDSARSTRARARAGRVLGSTPMTVARQTLGRRAERARRRRGSRRAGWRSSPATPAPSRGSRRDRPDRASTSAALVFVEVKARRAAAARGPERPAMAVGPRKRRKLRALAAAWLRDRGYDVPPPPRAALRRRRAAPRRTAAASSRADEHLDAARSDAACRRPRPQLELRVGDRLERAAVKRRGAVLDDRRAVLGGRVADVAVEPEAPGRRRRRGACSGRG